MAVKVIDYVVGLDGITPSTIQQAGMQGDHNVTTVRFDATKIGEALNGVYDNLYWRIEGRNATGKKKTTLPALVESWVFDYPLENWLTREGGQVTVRLVISAVDDSNKTLLDLYTFVAKLTLQANPGYADDQEYKGVVTLYEEALKAADDAETAKDAAEKATYGAGDTPGAQQYASQVAEDAAEVASNTERVKKMHGAMGNTYALFCETLKNADKINALTTILEQNKSKFLSFWIGSREEYEAIAVKTENCFYIITGDTTDDDLRNTTEAVLAAANAALAKAEETQQATNGKLDTFGKSLDEAEERLTDAEGRLDSAEGNIEDIQNRDYIVEQGTDGKWTYRKWNSGISECWCIHVENVENTKFVENFYVHASGSIFFPSGMFIEQPLPSVTCFSPSYNHVTVQGCAATAISLYYMSPVTSEVDVQTFIRVIGKWK